MKTDNSKLFLNGSCHRPYHLLSDSASITARIVEYLAIRSDSDNGRKRMFQMAVRLTRSSGVKL